MKRTIFTILILIFATSVWAWPLVPKREHTLPGGGGGGGGGGVTYSLSAIKYVLTAGMLTCDFGDWQVAQSIDGDTATHCFQTDGNGPGNALYVNLGAGVKARFGRFRWYQAAGLVSVTFKVQYLDGAVWKDASLEVSNAAAPQWNLIDWSHIGEWQQWRVLKTNAAIANGWTEEIEFYVYE